MMSVTKPGQFGGLALVAVLGRANPANTPAGVDTQHGEAHHQQAAHDGVSQTTAVGAGGWGGLREHVPVQSSKAVGQQHAQNQSSTNRPSAMAPSDRSGQWRWNGGALRRVVD